ncbi:uncharacterized protein [Rutidosis leptorrhynchoides]|uniref:uncharacterized protein n=1 Tax=Rutidosis leptorrhynchoides TaxID=125765 RepID=UPI003A9A4072
MNLDCLILHRRDENGWNWQWKRENLGSRIEALINELNTVVSQASLTNEADSRIGAVCENEIFSVASTRKAIDNQFLLSMHHSPYWHKSVPKKVDIFIWRIAIDRLPTRLNLWIRDVQFESIACPLCNLAVEVINHLSFSYGVVKKIWRRVNFWTAVKLPSFDDWVAWLDCLITGLLQPKLRTG